ncbi:ubiquitin family protein [Cooperia oncophora]
MNEFLLSSKMRMNIRLKIMDQTDHRFEVDDQTLLSDFRLQVAERLHIPPDRQRMIFAGHVLKNENSTLSACGLRDGHVVHLVERPADMCVRLL